MRAWSCITAVACLMGAMSCGGTAPVGASPVRDGGDETTIVISGASEGVSGSADAAPSGVCLLAPLDSLPSCSLDVTEGGACDDSVHGCRSATDAAQAKIFVCMNLADGIALQWTTVTTLQSPCQDRTEVACAAGAGMTDQALIDGLVASALGACLGSESWLNVAFAGGCATAFTLSSTTPDQIACVQGRLGAQRYSCAENVGCAGALVSTLH